MNAATKKPSLGDYAIKQQVENNATDAEPTELERTKGKGDKVSIAVRLGKEDWHKLHDFANRQGISLQKLIVLSLAETMKAKGVRPITGK